MQLYFYLWKCEALAEWSQEGLMAIGPKTNEERIKQDPEFTFSTYPQTSLLTKMNGTNVTQVLRFESKAFAGLGAWRALSRAKRFLILGVL